MKVIGWNANLKSQRIGRSAAETRWLHWNQRLLSLIEHRFDGKVEILDSAEGVPMGKGRWIKHEGAWYKWLQAHSGTFLARFNRLDVSSAELNEIEDLLGLMHLAQNQHHQINSLERLETQLLGQSATGNIVRLEQARLTGEEFSPPQEDRFRYDFRLPCLIESNNFHDITRMALEIHEHNRRVAFIHYHQLDESTRRSSEELLSLSGVSLFIPDISELNQQEQKALFDLLRPGVAREIPHVLSGTLSPLRELVEAQVIHADLLRLLATVHLRMNQPFQHYLKSGVMEFFLSSMRDCPKL